MYAPVRHQAPRIIPEPAVIKEIPAGIKWPRYCRPQPHFIIHAGWRRRIGYNRTGFHPLLVTTYFDRPDISQLTGIYKIQCILEMFLTALPLTTLYCAIIF